MRVMKTLTVLTFMAVITGTAGYVGAADGQQLLAGERERVSSAPSGRMAKRGRHLRDCGPRR